MIMLFFIGSLTVATWLGMAWVLFGTRLLNDDE